MRAVFSIACFCLLLSLGAKGQQNYAVNLISSDLKARAGAVVRNEEFTIEVKSLNQVDYRYKRAVTILNGSADAEARIAVWYNKTRQIKSVKATVYNEYGMPIGKVSEKDFKDESAASNFSLFEDSRVKRFMPAIITYPFTIEVEYEIRSKQSLIFPEWSAIQSEGVSLERSRFTFLCGSDFGIRYKELNYPGQAVISTGPKEQKSYVWEVKNVKALKTEPYSLDPSLVLPSVKVAPVKFSFQDVSGYFNNWNEYGLWMNETLLKGKDKISEETITKVRDMVAGLAEPRDKAKKIYEFVQQKSRYVSVQIGIGGYEPIAAAEVDRLGYGDCKALVNYTKALLTSVGIKSYYTLVEAGNYKLDAIADFASMNQFNHAILCIPLEKDTAWVDCTSKTLPFGYLGDFTDDRLVLVCTEDGGKLFRTPKMKTEDNQQQRKAKFILGSAGELQGEMTTTFSGWQYDNRETLIGEPFTEQVKMLRTIYPMNNLEVQSFKLQQEKNERPKATEYMVFQARDYALISGKRYSVSLNAVNTGRVLKEVVNRKNPVYISRGYIDSDEIIYTLPADYRVEAKPENQTLKNEFGEFSTEISVADNILIYKRKLRLNEGLYSAETYARLVDFYQRIYESDHASLTLIKKN